MGPARCADASRLRCGRDSTERDFRACRYFTEAMRAGKSGNALFRSRCPAGQKIERIQRTARRSRVLARTGAVELNDLVDRTGKRRQNALEHAAHRAEDVGEADAALEEGLDGDFIGGVEDDGRAVVGGQRIVGGLKKREGLRVGLLEGQPTDFGKAQALRAAVKPFGPAEGVGNRRAHVSRTQLRDDRAVLELDRRVYDALGVDHDLDAPGLEVEEPARLDHLKALVHEARGVDADLAAHGPLRMSDGLLRRDALKIRATAERAAGRP